MLRVAKDERGAYRTVGEALRAAKAGASIAIAPGQYIESLRIERPVTLFADKGPGTVYIDTEGLCFLQFAGSSLGAPSQCEIKDITVRTFGDCEALGTINGEFGRIDHTAVFVGDRRTLRLVGCALDLHNNGIAVERGGTLEIARCRLATDQWRMAVASIGTTVLTGTTIVGAAVRALDGGSMSLDDVQFRKPTNGAVPDEAGVFVQAARATIARSSFEDLYTAILAVAGSTVDVTDTTFGAASIAVTAGSTLTVIDGRFSGTHGDRWAVAIAKAETQLTRCSLAKLRNAVAVQEGGKLRVNESTFTDIGRVAVKAVSASSAEVLRSVIEGVDGNEPACHVEDASLTIDGGKVAARTIALFGLNARLKVFGCDLSSYGSRWVVGVGGTTEAVLEKSTVRGGGADGVTAKGLSRVTLTECEISNCRAAVVAQDQSVIQIRKSKLRGNELDAYAEKRAAVELEQCEGFDGSSTQRFLTVKRDGDARIVSDPLTRIKDDRASPPAVSKPPEPSQPAETEVRRASTSGLTSDKATQLLAELDGMVGLSEVKIQIRRLINRLVVAERRGRGLPPPQNLIFSGAPGTGKTTIARLYGKLLAATGLLPGDRFHEVSRPNLVGEYQGHTAGKVREAFELARPGVLFIDEVYSLKLDQGDTFGQEAIDTLVKLMEDNRTEVAVIVAGYSERIPAFLRANPGLRSRFTRTIVFPNYSVAELFQIFEGMLASDGLVLAAGADQSVTAALDRISTRSDFSNARDLRNLLQTILDKQADRLTSNPEASPNQILADDVVADASAARQDPARLERLLGELDGMVGLANVKKQVRQVIAAVKLKQQSGREMPVGQHLIFAGSPGTGKTTVARKYGQMLAALGVLAQGQVVEVSRRELVAEYLGQTAVKVESAFEKAHGGVLFIDEAYSLRTNDNDPYGAEAVNSLTKLMEDRRDDVVVIAAGYSDEMRRFLATNVGLRSRFARTIEFENYSVTEHVQIFEDMATRQGLSLSSEAHDALVAYVERVPKGPQWGNAREMRKLFEAAEQRLAERVALDPETDESLLVPEDLEVESGLRMRAGMAIRDQAQVDSLLKRLSGLVGLAQVKQQIQAQVTMISFNQERVRRGLAATQIAQHLVFAGAPGTGKTSVARIYGELLAATGILAKGQVVEAKRGDLVGSKGPQMVEDTFNRALGGVLFIDEAYSLKTGPFDYAGQEAIEALLSLMEDHRDEVVVVAAGYSDQMQEFLSANPGLASRFGQMVQFPDYTTPELTTIFRNLAEADGYSVSADCDGVLIDYFDTARGVPGFGNARTARNLLHASVMRLAIRHQGDLGVDVSILTPADVSDGR